MREYTWAGKRFQFDEGSQPKGAVEVKAPAAPPDNKAIAPARNKAAAKPATDK